jgi:hypothetical protein
MSYFVPHDGDWIEAAEAPDAPPYIEINDRTDRPPTVRLVTGPDAAFTVSGAALANHSDTVHTIAVADPTTGAGRSLCAAHTHDGEITVTDLRSSGTNVTVDDGLLDGFRADLDEILIPVYIDDAVEGLSEDVDGLVVLHTAQHDAPRGGWSYFRTSVFEDGALQLEAERGHL